MVGCCCFCWGGGGGVFPSPLHCCLITCLCFRQGEWERVRECPDRCVGCRGWERQGECYVSLSLSSGAVGRKGINRYLILYYHYPILS